MPKKVKCCVPGCGNNYKTQGTLHFYRIPKDVDIRNAYRLLLRNKCVRLDSENTRICSAHFENGLKLSRCHLPNKFPWKEEEDQKTGEKRKHLEQIASVLKTKRAMTTLTEEQLRDRVEGYQYHVPWRFSGVPLNHGVVSSFKTLEEHERGRVQRLNTTEEPANLVERDKSRQKYQTNINDNNRNMPSNLHCGRMTSANNINASVNSMDVDRIQKTNTKQTPKVSLTLGTLATPIQQGTSKEILQFRPSYTYTSPSTMAVPSPSSQSYVNSSSGNKILHVDQNFFKPGVITSGQESGISITILNNSQTSLVNKVNLPIQGRESIADKSNEVIVVQDNVEVPRSQPTCPFSSQNHEHASVRVMNTKIYKESSSQTEVSEEDFQEMVKRMNIIRSENRSLKEEVAILKKKLQVQEFDHVQQCKGFDTTKLGDKELLFYTGFENLESLTAFLSFVKESASFLPVWGKVLKEKTLQQDTQTDEELSILGELSLFFMKIKLNLQDADLAHRFMITENKAQSVVYTWLQIFYAFSSSSQVCKQLPEVIRSGLRNYGIE